MKQKRIIDYDIFRPKKSPRVAGTINVIETKCNTNGSSNKRKKAVSRFRRCAQKRWSTLLHRIAVRNKMKETLGVKLWKQFVQDARIESYKRFIQRFEPVDGQLHCSGFLDKGISKQCPHSFKVHFEQYSMLKSLHLDHEFDLKMICQIWKERIVPGSTANHEAQVRQRVKTWSGGMSKKLLLWLLFEAVDFRCFDGNVQNSCHTYGRHRTL